MTSDFPKSYQDIINNFQISKLIENRMIDVNSGLSSTLDQMLSSPHASQFSDHIFAGYHPNKLFAAEVYHDRNEYIILIYDGLLNMSSVVATLLADRINLRHDGEVIPPILSIEESHNHFLAAFESIILNHVEFNTILLPGEKRVFSIKLHALITNFVLAHELSHIILGHVGDNNSHYTPSIAKTLNRWKQEIDADVMSISLLKHIYPNSTMHTIYVGATVFFEIAHYVESVISKFGLDKERIDQTHPPSWLRRGEIFRQTISDNYADYVGQDDTITTMHQRIIQFITYFREITNSEYFETLYVRNAVQEIILSNYSDRHDHNWLPTNISKDGLIDPNIIATSARHLNQSHDYACSLIAKIASSHLKIGEYSNTDYTLLLGVLLNYYKSLYSNHPNNIEFMKLLKTLIPTIDQLMEDVIILYLQK